MRSLAALGACSALHARQSGLVASSTQHVPMDLSDDARSVSSRDAVSWLLCGRLGRRMLVRIRCCATNGGVAYSSARAAQQHHVCRTLLPVPSCSEQAARKAVLCWPSALRSAAEITLQAVRVGSARRAGGRGGMRCRMPRAMAAMVEAHASSKVVSAQSPTHRSSAVAPWARALSMRRACDVRWRTPCDRV